VDFSTLEVEGGPIAAGAFKSVFRAEWRRGGSGFTTTVALLKLRGALGEIAREIEVFVKLGRHPHLATLMGVTTHPDGSTCMLVEFAPRGSLHEVLCQQVESNSVPSEAVRITVALQICEAMTQLVEHGVVHRDLASRNVLVFSFSPTDREQVRVKVTDYGLALFGAQGSRGVTTFTGEAARPVRWLSLEALQRRIYSQASVATLAWDASDVWAYGITLWEIWSGAMVPYWEVESDAEVVQKVARGERLERMEGCSAAMWTVMTRCWAPIPAKRPTFERLKTLLQDALSEAQAQEKVSECVVCLDGMAVIALLPCGHRCACALCVGTLLTCPICRKSVVGSVRVFDA
ncbi:tyrosine kinase-domain-containing protein, partial [Baffinella frigidus]